MGTLKTKTLLVGAAVLITIGFGLAALSHPMWHSLSVASDKVIDNLLFSSVAFTLLGILALLLAVRPLDRRTKRLCLIPALLILTPIAGLLIFRFTYVRPFTVTQIGGNISQGALSIRTPTVLIKPPEAGVTFSTVTIPGKQERFAYLILFNYGGELSHYSSSSPNTKGLGNGGIESPRGRWAEIIVGFTVDAKPVEGHYYVELDDSLTQVQTETMAIGENKYEISAGRVFLMNLTTAPPSCHQLDVVMPPVPNNSRLPDDALKAAADIRQILHDRHPDIAEFLN